MKRILSVILCVLLLSSCAPSQKDISTPLTSEYEIEEGEWIDLSSYNAIVDMWLFPSGLFFLACDSMDDMTELKACCYSFIEKKAISIGTIKNMMFIGGTQRVVNDKFYFCVNSVGADGKKYNTLYSVDLRNYILEAVTEDEYYQTFNYMVEFQGKLLVTKGDINTSTGEGVTWIDIVDNNGSVVQSSIRYQVWLSEGRNGQVLLNSFVNKDELYCIVEDTTDNETNYYIDVYSESLEKIRSCELKEMKELLQGRILYNTNMIGDILYIRDFSMLSQAAIQSESSWIPMNIPERLEQAKYVYENNLGETIFLLNADSGDVVFFRQNEVVKTTDKMQEIEEKEITSLLQCGDLVVEVLIQSDSEGGTIQEYYLSSVR